MLRSESLWFPIFLELCARYLEFLQHVPRSHYGKWKLRQEMREILPKVLDCVSFRQVQNLVKPGWLHKRRLLRLRKEARAEVRDPDLVLKRMFASDGRVRGLDEYHYFIYYSWL